MRAGYGGRGSPVRAPAGELLREPRLPDARLAGQHDQPRAAALGGAPRRDQPLPLGRASDQRRPAGLGWVFALIRQERGIGRLRLRRGGDVELALERGRAQVVGPQRARPVATRVVGGHQQPVRRLAERVLEQQTLGVGCGRRVLAARVQLYAELVQGVEVAAAQPLALGHDPLVGAAGEQVAAVDGDGLRQRGRVRAVEVVLERGDVDPASRARPPAQGPGRDLDELVGLGAAQGVQHVPEVGPRLRLGGVGPQQVRDPLTRLRRLPVQHEVGEQRLRPRRGQLERPALRRTQLEPTQQPDPHTPALHGVKCRSTHANSFDPPRNGRTWSHHDEPHCGIEAPEVVRVRGDHGQAGATHADDDMRGHDVGCTRGGEQPADRDGFQPVQRHGGRRWLGHEPHEACLGGLQVLDPERFDQRPALLGCVLVGPPRRLHHHAARASLIALGDAGACAAAGVPEVRLHRDRPTRSWPRPRARGLPLRG